MMEMGITSGSKVILVVCTGQIDQTKHQKRRKKKMSSSNRAKAILKEAAVLKETEFIYLPFPTREDMLSFKSQLHRERNVLRRNNFSKEFIIRQNSTTESEEHSLRVYAVKNTFNPMIISLETKTSRPLEFTLEEEEEVTVQVQIPTKDSDVDILRGISHETEVDRITRLMREDGVEEKVISEVIGRMLDEGGDADTNTNDQDMEHPEQGSAEVAETTGSISPQSPEGEGGEERGPSPRGAQKPKK
jgi:hypothetical protein